MVCASFCSCIITVNFSRHLFDRLVPQEMASFFTRCSCDNLLLERHCSIQKREHEPTRHCDSRRLNPKRAANEIDGCPPGCVHRQSLPLIRLYAVRQRVDPTQCPMSHVPVTPRNHRLPPLLQLNATCAQPVKARRAARDLGLGRPKDALHERHRLQVRSSFLACGRLA